MFLNSDVRETRRRRAKGVHSKCQTGFSILYWFRLKWHGVRDRGWGPGGRPGLDEQVVSHHHWVVGAAGDGFDHFGHLEVWVGRTLSASTDLITL